MRLHKVSRCFIRLHPDLQPYVTLRNITQLYVT
jgi:hypothetical protein